MLGNTVDASPIPARVIRMTQHFAAVKTRGTTMKLNLMSQRINGREYGIGRCNVQVGLGNLDGVAVVADGERWISTEASCVEWLANRGLDKDEAKRFVSMGLKAWDESHSIGIA
jgi:hypothetical protein